MQKEGISYIEGLCIGEAFVVYQVCVMFFFYRYFIEFLDSIVGGYGYFFLVDEEMDVKKVLMRS